jgi:hypothetical protein
MKTKHKLNDKEIQEEKQGKYEVLSEAGDDLSVRSERTDDHVVLLHIMMKIRLPEILDRHLKRHGLQEGLSWGWLATIWLHITRGSPESNGSGVDKAGSGNVGKGDGKRYPGHRFYR